jgi:hypothetical protein
MPRILIDLNYDGSSLFDNSSAGLKISTSGKVAAPAAGNNMFVSSSTRIRIGRSLVVDRLDAFTFEATINPERLGRVQTIVDSQTPPIKVSIDSSGTVTAGVHTGQGWQVLKSSKKVSPGSDTELRFMRDNNEELMLEINGLADASIVAAGALKAVGRAGISIGTDVRGKAGFAGLIRGVRLFEGADTTTTRRRRITKARKLSRVVERLYEVPARVIDNVGEVDSRFNTIKAMLRSVGVDNLSTLSTLTLNQPTVIAAGTVLKAPPANESSLTPSDWSKRAAEFVQLASGNLGAAKKLADRTLLCRSVGRAVAQQLTEGLASGAVNQPGVNIPTIRPPRRIPSTSLRTAPTAISGGILRRAGTGNITTLLSTLNIGAKSAITPNEGIERLMRDQPDAWPIMTDKNQLLTSAILPVDSAVIIAKRLDLTNQTLEIDPSVGTLYIIAEEILAANGARITWKRTPIQTPNIGQDPLLDGRDRHGVDLAPNSKHGMPGGDARDGAPGISAFNGQDAPNVEIWALRFNGMPDIDLEGQAGGRGGRGQKGGEGGNGARGRAGEWWWFFGRKCWDNPGNGGNGGHGGDGGRGGSGGNGGDAGDITFAILAQTLASLTTSNAFNINLAGGDPGRGGDGGLRGEGGRGGERGYTEVCTGGHAGAQGQPGRVGAEGPAGSEGSSGQMSIMTVTQESWDEQLTRPWLLDISPSASLPGGAIVVKGSRFADTDEVRIDARTVASTLRADGGRDVTIPSTITGGEHSIYIRRHDGQESNRLPLTVKPQLTGVLTDLVPGAPIELDGRAFLSGASVEFGGDFYPAVVSSPTKLTFNVPEVTETGGSERTIALVAVNPDGQRSNTLMGRMPRVLRNGFTIGTHDFSFNNDSDGRPSWSTFEDTFGAVEIWHELLDPIFGHKILTTAYYFFYEHFLKGEANGGLATGFCTSLASIALDRFWLGRDDTFSSVVRDDAFRRQMTAIHGRLLSREALLDFHNQGRRGNANVESTFREIEAIFAAGGTRETAPLLFFVPAGAAWDAGYFDMLADSHCIVPIRIVYPIGYDGSSLQGVRMYCWDNNHSNDHRCFVDFRVEGNETLFNYTANGSYKFDSVDGITLAVSTLGEYLLRDVDLPFGGPFGLTSFIVDFLLSPATMQVSDGSGRLTGQVGGQIISEIPDSHPMYLVPNGYLLPSNVGLTRQITGTAAGSYSYGSISPDGLSLSLTNVPTQMGQSDRVLVNADGSRVRVVPGDSKTLNLTMGRLVGDTARGVSIENFLASPTDDLDVTSTPDLSMVRLSNRGAAARVDVKLLGFDMPRRDRMALARGALNIPSGKDLVIAVADWKDLVDANVTTTVIDN